MEKIYEKELAEYTLSKSLDIDEKQKIEKQLQELSCIDIHILDYINKDINLNCIAHVTEPVMCNGLNKKAIKSHCF